MTLQVEPSESRWSAALSVACVAVAGMVIVVQVTNLPNLLDVNAFLTAGFAKGLVLGYSLAVCSIVGFAVICRSRWLYVPLAGASGVALIALLLTLTVGGQAWTLAVAILTMAACWQTGHWLLSLLRANELAGLVPAAWLSGTAVLGVLMLALGRIGLIHWWTAGLAIVVLGGVGLVNLVRGGNPGDLRRLRDALLERRLSAASAAILVLTLGLVCVWTAAPELMFDAYYAKAWLPAEWARTGSIDPHIFRLHPVTNGYGFAQLLAIPGHTLGAPAIGRYLQLFALAALLTCTWWCGRRSKWAPLAAVVVALTPQIFWQATTANDDLILALGVLSLAVAVVSLMNRADPPEHPVSVAIGVGLLAGACIVLKLHLAALVGAIVLGWWFLGAGRSWRAAVGVAVGGSVAVLASFGTRWVDSGNPVMPALNNIFKSPYWPAVNEKLNLPYLADPGPWGPVSVLVKSVTEPSVMQEAAPVGSVGLLTGAILLAIIFGWRGSRPVSPGSNATKVLWFGLVVACIAWYLQLRYLRYLLPAGAVAMFCLLLLSGDATIGKRLERMVLVSVAVLAVVLWPSTVAMFWNVPGRDIPIEVVLGLTAEADYERASVPQRDAVMAFNEAAPPRALALADPMTRVWLKDGRDLTPNWELGARLLVGADAVPSVVELAKGSAAGSVVGGPNETFERYRKAGVSWVIAQVGSAILADPVVQGLLAEHGELHYRDNFASVWQLVKQPDDPSAEAACDASGRLSSHCWVAGAARRPEYAGATSPASVWRVIPVCAGETLLAKLTVPARAPAATATIRFSGENPEWLPSISVMPGTTGQTAAPVPAGAREATITIDPVASDSATRARVLSLGVCERGSARGED